MTHAQAMIEEESYRNDGRVRALAGKWWKRIDDKRMVAVVEVDEEEREVPITFEVCGTCDGRGTHVNPSIDAGGLTAEDFADDPDFAEDYRSGVHDVTCYECDGRRVVPVCQDDEVNEEIANQQADDAAYRAEVAAERRAGA